MIKRAVQGILGRYGLRLIRESSFDPAMEEEFQEIYKRCKDFTMTSMLKMYALYNAIRYIVKRGVDGDIVECGVWKGGSCMVAALALKSLGDVGRTIYLYDTYSGMSKPDKEKDVSFGNLSGRREWEKSTKGDISGWCFSPIEEVEANMRSTGYPKEFIRFVKGKVEETLPTIIPARLALLRLDTDWFHSTYHELVHLYPKLSSHGVLILDDYGYWKGAKSAVDRYFEEKNEHVFLSRIDGSGRLAIKP